MRFFRRLTEYPAHSLIVRGGRKPAGSSPPAPRSQSCPKSQQPQHPEGNQQ